MLHRATFDGRGGLRAGLMVLALVSGGCGGTGPQESTGKGDSAPGSGSGSGPRLMFISNTNSDWWTAVETGMKEGGKAFGAQVELRRNGGQPEGQIRLLEDALSLPDVKGVALSVLEAESPGIADKMRDLQKMGKIVITIDSDGPSDARRAYIGTNNRKAGEVAGQVARTLRPQGGKVAVFVGFASAANGIERREGFFNGAGPKFQQVEVFEDLGDKSGRAQSNVQTAISKYPDIGLFVGLYSYNGPLIAEDVARSPELRKRSNIVAFDLDELSVGMLEEAKIDATVCQNPYEMGYQGVRLLKALVEKDEKTIDAMLPGGAQVIDTGVRVIVPTKDSPVKGDNVLDIKEMKDWLLSKNLKSS